MQAVPLEGKGSERGFACRWWAIINGLEVDNIAAGQIVAYDTESKVARIQYFARDADGRRVFTEDGLLSEVRDTPIVTPPDAYGLSVCAYEPEVA